MKDTAIYICQQNASNKFWKYTILPNNTIQCVWGRLGQDSEEFGEAKSSRRLTKGFGSRYSAEAFVEKKLREKTNKKGYVEKTKKEVKQEQKTAEKLGFRNKIKRMLWVRKSGKKLKTLKQYDPNQWVYVEILDSWSKAITRLLLSKSESHVLTGVAEDGNTITYARDTFANNTFASAVRDVLRQLAKAVQKVVTIKLADMGIRDLGLTDEPVNFSASDFEEITEAIGDASAESGVICTLAALGVRKLDL